MGIFTSRIVLHRGTNDQIITWMGSFTNPFSSSLNIVNLKTSENPHQVGYTLQDKP